MVSGVLVRAERVKRLGVQEWKEESPEYRAWLRTEQKSQSGSGNMVRAEGNTAGPIR